MKRKRLVVLSLVLLELVLCAGMYSIVQATAVTLSGITMALGSEPSAMAQALEEQRIAVDGPVTLAVDNSHGDVKIVAGAEDGITISAHKQVWAPTEADAQVVLAGLDLHLTKEGNAVTLHPTLPPPSSLTFGVVRPSADITITVPATTAVSGHVLSGAITLSGTTGGAELTTNRGSISINDVEGRLVLQSDNGDITADHVQGQIQITSNRGTLHLADIRTEGELIGKTLTGDVALKDCAASSIVVQIGRGRADLTACTARGVQVSTGTGDLSLSKIQADTFRLQAQRGSIGVDGAAGLLQARTDTGNITLTNGDRATLDVATQRGTISYTGSLGQGPHGFQSDSGDIQLSLPKDTMLTLEVQTLRGQINSQFPVMMTSGSGKNSWRGTINGGGAVLQAATRNGNIILNRTDP